MLRSLIRVVLSAGRNILRREKAGQRTPSRPHRGQTDLRFRGKFERRNAIKRGGADGSVDSGADEWGGRSQCCPKRTGCQLAGMHDQIALTVEASQNIFQLAGNSLEESGPIGNQVMHPEKGRVMPSW